MEDGRADLDLLADQRDQIDPFSFDIRSHPAGRDLFEAQRRRMFRDLLVLDQAHLAAARLASGLADTAKIARVSRNAFSGDKLNGLDGSQGRAGKGRVQM